MAKTKPKRKPKQRYSAAQVQRHIAAKSIKDLVAVYVFTGTGSTPKIFNKRTMKEVFIDTRIDAYMKDYPYRWSTKIALLLREKNGKRKLISEDVSAVYDDGTIAPIAYADFAPGAVEHHVRLVQEYPHKDLVVTVGWIADPSGKGMSAEDEMRLYELAGAYHRFIAPWELEREEAAGNEVERVA